MSLPTVGVFTDTYLPTVNGVSYTVALWRDRYVRRGGTQWLVYPDHPDRAAADGERPVRSVPLPIYPDFRVAPPMLPDGIGALDLVHVHSPFGMGLAGRRAARDVPLVVSYHTPTPAYAAYVPGERPSNARSLHSRAGTNGGSSSRRTWWCSPRR
jgi:hypothetical protein